MIGNLKIKNFVNQILQIKIKYIILGGGPNRIGQGIEFDYCCVHAVYASERKRY